MSLAPPPPYSPLSWLTVTGTLKWLLPFMSPAPHLCSPFEWVNCESRLWRTPWNDCCCSCHLLLTSARLNEIIIVFLLYYLATGHVTRSSPLLTSFIFSVSSKWVTCDGHHEIVAIGQWAAMFQSCAPFAFHRQWTRMGCQKRQVCMDLTGCDFINITS